MSRNRYGSRWPWQAARLTCLGALLAASVGCGKDRPNQQERTLLLYCGAGLRPAVAEAIEAFTAKTGVNVQCDYAGSGVLVARVKLERRGDLLMPGDVWYLEQVAKEGLLDSKTMVTYFVPVIIVRKGTGQEITKLADLARPGVRLALGNPEACQIGRLTEKIFAKNRIDMEAIRDNTTLASMTVNELGVWVQTGRADAAIVWDAIAAHYADDVKVVAIPPEQNIISHVAIGVLRSSRNTQLARKFVEFLTSDEARGIFKKHHYQTLPPDEPTGGRP